MQLNLAATVAGLLILLIRLLLSKLIQPVLLPASQELARACIIGSLTVKREDRIMVT